MIAAPPAGGGRGRPRSRGAGQRGQSLVEVALLLPMLMALICALLEFGLMAADALALQAAAQDGAQAGAAQGLSQAGADADAVAAAQDAAGALVRCPLAAPQATYDDSVSPAVISVSVACTYSPITPAGPLIADLAGGSASGQLTLTSTAQWRIQT